MMMTMTLTLMIAIATVVLLNVRLSIVFEAHILFYCFAANLQAYNFARQQRAVMSTCFSLPTLSHHQFCKPGHDPAWVLDAWEVYFLCSRQDSLHYTLVLPCAV